MHFKLTSVTTASYFLSFPFSVPSEMRIDISRAARSLGTLSPELVLRSTTGRSLSTGFARSESRGAFEVAGAGRETSCLFPRGRPNRLPRAARRRESNSAHLKMTVERESDGRQHQSKGEQRRCLGTLLAHYVKHSRTKDGKERVIAKGPRCYGVSWNTSAQGRQRTKNAVTLDAVERELGKPGPGAALKLDWACAGMSSYNTRASASASSGGKVELPQCGGIEVILSNELEFVSKEER